MKSTRRSSLPYQALSVLAFLLLSSGTSLCQQAARPERGSMPNRTYSLSEIEAISLQNGNVNLSIPLASLPPIAGGKLSWTVSANYNSKLWNVVRLQGEDSSDTQWNPYVVDAPSLDGGWRIGGRYVMLFRSSNEDFHRVFYPGNSGLPSWELNLLNNVNYWKMVLVMPDGSEHEFRPVDHSSYGGTQDFLRGYFNVFPNGSAVRYYSVDGTYMFARISGQFDWTVYMPDGTRIIQTPDGVQRIQDTNGNKIKLFSDANGDHYQDEQTGREIRVTYDPAANGGQGQRRVWYSTVTGIQHYLDINLGKTSVQGKTYLVEGWQPEGGEEGGAICQHTELLSMQVPVVREIVFPQTEPTQPQRRFTFSYNSDTTESASNPVNWTCNGGFAIYSRQASRGWGELSRMVTPSGSIVDYSYELDSQHALLGSADDLSRQSITEKKVTHDGTVDTWDYSISELGAAILSPDGNNVTESRHCITAGCSNGKAGLVYRTTAPFEMTERHWTNLTFSGANTASPGGVLTFNPIVDFEYTTLLDASNNPLKMSAKAFQYDFNGNLTQTTEYDWFDHTLVSRDAQGVPTGVPASATVLRVTNNSHYNQATSASSANVYAKRSVSTGLPLILNAIQQITTGPGIIQFSYDGQAYGVAPTVGNLTTRKAWVNLDNKWITTSNTYGLYGNVATSTDARGKVTQFFYDDATQALPTRVVVDPQNGTGTQTTTTAYDFSTGLVTSQTDVNGQVSSVDYTNQLLGMIDPFGRPGITRSPTINLSGTNHRQRTTTTYLDSIRQEIVETDLNAEADKLLKTRTTVDMLGRPILIESTEGGTNYTISTRSAYLNMGQVTLTSTPMRSTAASTDSWTRVTKDGAGRVTEVATFGGAAQPAWSGTAGAFTGAVTTTYTANFTTVTDQAGKVRRSMTDALGRLIRVDEPDSGGNLGSTASPTQPTSYSYDVFANLTTVTQGSQSRTFTYDSLSRLRTAINPESGTLSYQYDDGGNLLVKTDARGVSVHYDYDALNRVTRRWYNGSNLVSAITHNSPSLPSGVGATNEAKFFYDSQALPAGAPSYSRGSAIGRLVAQTYGTAANGDYYAYDVLGRPTLKIQQTGSVNYQLTADYTLAGAVKSLIYPSGHTITNTYDLAGRLSGFSGNLGDGTTRTYSTPLVYSPLQNVLKEQFGTTSPVYNKIHYNSRAQICDVRASAVNDEWGGELGALVNYYSTNWSHCGNGPDNNGNVLMSQTIVNSFYVEDRYSYDSLNRLTAVNEYQNGATHTGSQQYDYDRWGNRTIKPASWGTGINTKQFTKSSVNNRLEVPVGQSGVMSYDAAGNLTNDTYTGAGTRTYDAENKITSAWGGNNQAQLYAYDASGQRIKRTVDGVETWQVYGFGGELIAEYAVNVAAATPQKEYGYRHGQLLVTATAGSGLVGQWKTNENTGTSTADSSGNGSTGTLTSGAGWTTGHSGSAVIFDGVNDYVQVGAQSKLVVTTAASLSAWIYPTGPGSEPTHGGTILVKEGEYVIARYPNGTIRWGFANSNPGWTFVDTGYVAPLNQWTHITITYDNGTIKTYANGSLVHAYSGSGSIGDAITGQNDFRIGGRQVISQYFQGRIDEVRVYNRVLAATEVSALASGPATAVLAVNWLVTDHLGTPRMIVDQTGLLANVKRHDYLPFGEELFAPAGGRSTALGYAGGDGVRQQFTQKERDVETGLDYFLARYYSSTQGRFTSPDEFTGGPDELYDFVDVASENPTFYGDLNEPQSLNKYQYVYNNPLGYVDPDGHAPNDKPYPAHVDDVDAERNWKEWQDARAEAHRGLGKFQRGGGPPRRPNGGNRGNPRSDPRNWQNRGGRQVYVGPGSWTYGTGRPRQPRYPTFRNLKDHAKRHSELPPYKYYEQARLHMERHQWKFIFRHDNQTKVAYVTQLGPDWFIFTSTTPSGNRIFTHMPVDGQYLRNIGITLPKPKRK